MIQCEPVRRWSRAWKRAAKLAVEGAKFRHRHLVAVLKERDAARQEAERLREALRPLLECPAMKVMFPCSCVAVPFKERCKGCQNKLATDRAQAAARRALGEPTDG